jgi:hypothetical protein
MTTPERACPEADVARGELLEAGYRDVTDCPRGLAPGVRVRHVGQQYVEAYRDGTATVLHVMENVGSTWSRSYRSRDIEVLVQRDRPLVGTSLLGQWADYHCAVVTPGPDGAL